MELLIDIHYEHASDVDGNFSVNAHPSYHIKQAYPHFLGTTAFSSAFLLLSHTYSGLYYL